MTYKPFFYEWVDSKETVSLIAIFSILFMVATMGIYVNFPQESYRAMLYLMMLVICMAIGLMDTQFEKNWICAISALGTSFEHAFFAIAAGAVVMAILIQQGSFLSLSAPLVVISDASWKFFYIVLVAPFVEEQFFRMAGIYTLLGDLRNLRVPYYDIIAVLFANFSFAIFHGFAYGWSYPAMVAAFIFGIFVSIGNQFFKSAGFGLGAHFMNNLLIFMR